MNGLKCCFIAGSVIGAVACVLGIILIPVGDVVIGNTVKKVRLIALNILNNIQKRKKESSARD